MGALSPSGTDTLHGNDGETTSSMSTGVSQARVTATVPAATIPTATVSTACLSTDAVSAAFGTQLITEAPSTPDTDPDVVVTCAYISADQTAAKVATFAYLVTKPDDAKSNFAALVTANDCFKTSSCSGTDPDGTAFDSWQSDKVHFAGVDTTSKFGELSDPALANYRNVGFAIGYLHAPYVCTTVPLGTLFRTDNTQEIAEVGGRLDKLMAGVCGL